MSVVDKTGGGGEDTWVWRGESFGKDASMAAQQQAPTVAEAGGSGETTQPMVAGAKDAAPIPDLFTRVFPKQLSDDCEAFNYSACRFHVSKSKEGCARVVAHKELKIEAAYTMEASFLGGTRGQFRGRHFTQHDLLSIGRKLGESMAPFLDHESLRRTMQAIDHEERGKRAAADIPRQLDPREGMLGPLYEPEPLNLDCLNAGQKERIYKQGRTPRALPRRPDARQKGESVQSRPLEGLAAHEPDMSLAGDLRAAGIGDLL